VGVLQVSAAGFPASVRAEDSRDADASRSFSREAATSRRMFVGSLLLTIPVFLGASLSDSNARLSCRLSQPTRLRPVFVLAASHSPYVRVLPTLAFPAASHSPYVCVRSLLPPLTAQRSRPDCRRRRVDPFC
jgi:hypothetical protein